MGATALINSFPHKLTPFFLFKFSINSPKLFPPAHQETQGNKMKSSIIIPHAMLLLIALYLTTYTNTCQATSFIASRTSKNIYTEFIKASCNTTLYPQLCYKSMSKFAEKIHANPKLLANTSISVARKEAKSTFTTMKNMSKYKGLSVGERAALRDCVEVSDDSVYEFQRSMDQMDHMDDGDAHFDFEISNVQTWVSAALTDYTTCMDGFYNVNEGYVKAKVCKYAVNVSQLTSISLTFINRYAESGRRA